MFCLKKYDYIPEEYIILYDDSKAYADKLNSILCKISTKYVLFNHEKHVLVHNVISEKLDEIIVNMDISSVDQVRLHVSGINEVTNDNILLKINNGPYFISITPGIWNVNTLLGVTSKFLYKPYNEIESEDIQLYVSKLKNYYTCLPGDIFYKRGDEYRSISYFFPIFQCTHRLKWHNDDYIQSKFIDDIAVEYNIDLSIRGKLY